MITVHGFLLQMDPEVLKELETVAIPEDLQHQEHENICKAGTLGAVRMPVLLAWFAGTGLGTRTGTTSPDIIKKLHMYCIVFRTRRCSQKALWRNPKIR